ncbi:MAG: hypothetical protein R2713_05520 [Ilumatobacteraceae bacterium]
MEHFDGYKHNPEFSLRALEAAVVKGAPHVVLCDTNGGSLPHEVEQIVADVYRHGRRRHDRYPLPRRHRLSPTRWPRACRCAMCRARSTVWASAPATATSPPSSRTCS